MAPVDWRRWAHRFANLILFVIYIPSNLHTLLLAFDLVDHFDELSTPWFVLGAFVSATFVDVCLLLTIFAMRRLKPRTLLALQIFLFIYVVPHTILATLLAPGALPGAWVP